MNVVEINEGPKVDYEVIGSKIFFNDELMLNLEKYERDDDQFIDICENENFALAMGLGRKYVAQIEIPARQYVDVIKKEDVENEEGVVEPKETIIKEPVVFKINNVTLNLWGLE